MSSLATEEYNFKNVAIFSKDKAKLLFISIPFTDKSIIMTYEGLVKAGIKDCSQINIAANDSTKQITITCPNIEVFDDPIIYTDSIKFYDYSNNIFSPITPEDIVDFESSEESVAKQQAIDNGILDKAKDSAYNLLYNQAIAFINGTEYNDYQVYIKFV